MFEGNRRRSIGLYLFVPDVFRLIDNGIPALQKLSSYKCWIEQFIAITTLQFIRTWSAWCQQKASFKCFKSFEKNLKKLYLIVTRQVQDLHRPLLKKAENSLNIHNDFFYYFPDCLQKSLWKWDQRRWWQESGKISVLRPRAQSH